MTDVYASARLVGSVLAQESALFLSNATWLPNAAVELLAQPVIQEVSQMGFALKVDTCREENFPPYDSKGPLTAKMLEPPHLVESASLDARLYYWSVDFGGSLYTRQLYVTLFIASADKWTTSLER